MPALIVPLYSNVTVVKYVKGKDNEIKLDMVLILFALQTMEVVILSHTLLGSPQGVLVEQS